MTGCPAHSRSRGMRPWRPRIFRLPSEDRLYSRRYHPSHRSSGCPECSALPAIFPASSARMRSSALYPALFSSRMLPAVHCQVIPSEASDMYLLRRNNCPAVLPALPGYKPGILNCQHNPGSVQSRPVLHPDDLP